MSWSFTCTGKTAAAAVAVKAKEELARYRCAEPEETIKAKVSDVIETCLAAFPEQSAVTIKAYGSQSVVADGKAINNLSITIEPLYGFVE